MPILIQDGLRGGQGKVWLFAARDISLQSARRGLVVALDDRAARRTVIENYRNNTDIVELREDFSFGLSVVPLKPDEVTVSVLNEGDLVVRQLSRNVAEETEVSYDVKIEGMVVRTVPSKIKGAVVQLFRRQDESEK